MHYLSLIVLTLVFSASAFAQSPAEKKLLTLCQQKFDWMIKRDSIAFKKVLHPNLQYIHSSGKVDSRETLAATVTKGSTRYKKLEVYDAQARSFGSGTTIIVTGKLHYGAESKGEYKEYDLIFTEVYIKAKEGWLLVSRHASKI
jgi:ketosteroid isomerase-like protein